MIPIDKFSLNWETGTLTAEISDLGPNVFESLGAGAYEQCVRVSFGDRNVVISFTLASVDRDEGDITAWRLVPSEATMELFPNLAVSKMIIFND
jgi:hypothetical protein